MSTQDQIPETEQAAPSSEPLVAHAGAYYRNARYIMFAIIVGMGIWFIYDGFITYPAANRKYAALTQRIADLDATPNPDEAEHLRLTMQLRDTKHHEEFSIQLQKILGFSLPPIGLALLIYWLRKSRGEIRLQDGVLTAPTHPPVPVGKIDELDKSLWDRKGIAYAYYTLPDNTSGKVRLDDFIYQAEPIRQIVTRLEAELQRQDEAIATSPTDASAAKAAASPAARAREAVPAPTPETSSVPGMVTPPRPVRPAPWGKLPD